MENTTKYRGRIIEASDVHVDILLLRAARNFPVWGEIQITVANPTNKIVSDYIAWPKDKNSPILES